MGLIGGVLTPLYMGGRSVLMSPTAFLQRPIRWLQTIHEYRSHDQRCAELRLRLLRAANQAGRTSRTRSEPLAIGVLRRGADSARDAAAVCRDVSRIRLPLTSILSVLRLGRDDLARDRAKLQP